MRRIVSIILAAALFCLTLTACGSRQKTDLSGAKTIADLKGATIAAQAGTFHLDAVDQIEDVDKKSYPDFTDLLNALKSGAIDGYVAEEPTALEVCGKDDTLTYLPLVNNDTGFTATDAETGIAVAFQTGSPMVATVNVILATIPHRDPSGAHGADGSLSADPDTDAGDAIVLQSSNTDTSNGVFRIAMECAYAPSTGRRRPTPTAPCRSPARITSMPAATTCRLQSTLPPSSAWRWRSTPMSGIR